MAAVVIATETFDYVDDNTRQNDKPHAISLKHILEKLENAQSRGSVVQVGSEIVNPLASSTIGQIQPKVTDTIDVVRICRNDGKLRMPERLQDETVYMRQKVYVGAFGRCNRWVTNPLAIECSLEYPIFSCILGYHGGNRARKLVIQGDFPTGQ